MKKEKTVIIIETLRRTIVRFPRKKLSAFCKQCSAEVLLLSADEAAAFAQINVREIFRRLEAGELHFLETEEGKLFICQDSLPSRIL